MSGRAEINEGSHFSENRYRRFFESASDGLIIFDADSLEILDINLSALNLLGCSRSEAAGKIIGDAFLFSEKEEILPVFQKLRATNFSECRQFTIKTKDGDFREIEFGGSLARENERLVVYGIFRDITEHKRVAETLLQQIQKAATLPEIAAKAARMGGWTIQLPERKLTWSDENCAIHEVPPGYVPTLEEGISYYPPQYRAEVKRYVEKCAEEGTPYDFELPKYTAKGRLIWVRSIGEAVRNAEGRIIGLQGAFQDITHRKQAEQALLESQEQYRQIIEHASDIIYKTDAEGRFTFVNPTVHKILKYTEQELLALHYLDVVRPDFHRALKRAYRQQIVRKTPNTYYEFVALAKDGTEVWLGQHAQPLHKDNRIIGFQAICRDITQKKQTEDELRHLSLTDELTGLYNRRGFLALAEHQLKLALNKRIEKKLLVLYVDLDGLKQINDMFGHDEGSRAIVQTADILRQSFRHSDLVARLGGDEFVVLAIEANEENTAMIASRLQNNLLLYNERKNHSYDLAFSFGVARFESENEFCIENLIRRADEEMYHQKKRKKTDNQNK